LQIELAEEKSQSAFLFLENVSLDWEFQQIWGKLWGFQESRDVLGKLHFAGIKLGKVVVMHSHSDVKIRLYSQFLNPVYILYLVL